MPASEYDQALGVWAVWAEGVVAIDATHVESRGVDGIQQLREGIHPKDRGVGRDHGPPVAPLQDVPIANGEQSGPCVNVLDGIHADMPREGRIPPCPRAPFRD